MTPAPARPAKAQGPHVAIAMRKSTFAGGASQSLLGLIHSLGALEGPDRYTIVAETRETMEWLQPYCGPNQQIVRHQTEADAPATARRVRPGAVLKTLLTPLRPLARYVKQRLNPPRRWPEIPCSDGFLEGLGCDVAHFPVYQYMLCNVPTVYNPHDIQHRVYPQYISQDELMMREVVFAGGCRLAHAVVVGTQWVKDDLVNEYAIAPSKIHIIPWASSTLFYKEPAPDDLVNVTRKYELAEPFALFPANTWPHKNHLRLLEALAYLRDTRGLVIRLVCTGTPVTWFWPKIDACLRELNLGAQVKFVGSVPDADLRAMYRLAQFLVMPTLYEADSNPIHEAWVEGLPVASSNVTALPDQVKDAGLLFDPQDVEGMADVLARLATSDRLREQLRQRGFRRSKDFSWERTAKAYRAVYRRSAQSPLTDEDRWLLQWDWLREPDRTPPRPSPARRLPFPVNSI